VELAFVMEIPILGICMGCQLINVALGGTLVQDIPSQHPAAIQHSPGGDGGKVMHCVEIAEQSRLHTIVKADSIMVESSHHQAVRDLGKGLVVTARAQDDTIEAVEQPGAWILGVQWHPERLVDMPEHKALFAALVAAASAKS
jgi:putative glutamine amidotransferase